MEKRTCRICLQEKDITKFEITRRENRRKVCQTCRNRRTSINVGESGIYGCSQPKHLHSLEAEMARKSAFTVPKLPTSKYSIGEILESAKKEYTKIEIAKQSAKLVNISVKTRGPFGIPMFGDQHADNRKCNLPRLERDLDICKKNEGILLPINVGDLRDNWDDKKARLYQHQRRLPEESVAILEWLVKSVNWLCIVKGNHDQWNQMGGDVLDVIHKYEGNGGLLVENDARLKLNYTGGDVTIRVRHNFKGKSQYNPLHGMVKETLWNLKDDILVCGDWHHAGYMPYWHNQGRNGDGGMLCHLLRLGTYKQFDDYSEMLGFREENWTPAMLAIVDTETNDPVKKVTIDFNLESGVERLLWLRKKRGF
jgi:hypothetical protein